MQQFSRCFLLGLRSACLPALAGVLLAQVVACAGSVQDPNQNVGSGGDESTGGGGGTDQGGGNAAPVTTETCSVPNLELLTPRLWRLSHVQYANSVAQLLPGADLTDTTSFLPDEQLGAFANDSGSLRVSAVRAEQYAASAKKLATQAAAKAASLMPCAPDKADDACAQTFIESFGRKAFRRNIDGSERTALMAVWSEGKAVAAGAGGVQAIVEAVLQAPSFLYRSEIGEGPVKDGHVELSSDEIATALAFSLTNGPADDELLALAKSGQLQDSGTIRAQVRRLLQTEGGRNTYGGFVSQWMGYGVLKNQQVSDPAFKDWAAAWVPRMNNELGLYVDSVLKKQDATLEDLMLSPNTFVDTALGTIYGIEQKNSGFSSVSLQGTPRKGLLTMPGFLAAHSSDGEAHAIKRGVFANERLLCRRTPNPPAGAGVLGQAASQPGLTGRERLEAHRRDATCAGCHSLIDPPGLAFENFDGLGRYRTLDSGKRIDPKGTFAIDDQLTISFMDAADFADQISRTGAFKNCVSQQQLRFFLGIDASDSDSCVVRRISAELDATGGKLDKLVEAIAASPMFRLRRAL